MSCKPIMKNGKAVGWVCATSEPRTPPACYKCGAPATMLCDHRNMQPHYVRDRFGNKLRKVLVASINTCDRPMCSACANHISPDTDFCDLHNTEVARAHSARAERLYRQQVKHFKSEG